MKRNLCKISREGDEEGKGGNFSSHFGARVEKVERKQVIVQEQHMITLVMIVGRAGLLLIVCAGRKISTHIYSKPSFNHVR